MKLRDVDLCFARGDDIRHYDTPNLDILQTIEETGVLFESIRATVDTNDKFEMVVRAPHVPQPTTYAASSLKEARTGIPALDEIIDMYVSRYNHIIVQEFCTEVKNGDLLETFFDGELVAPMRRKPAWGS